MKSTVIVLNIEAMSYNNNNDNNNIIFSQPVEADGDRIAGSTVRGMSKL